MIALTLSGFLSGWLFLAMGYSMAKLMTWNLRWYMALLLGMAITNTLVNLVSLLMPINTNVLLGFVTLGIILTWWIRTSFQSIGTSIHKHRSVLWAALPIGIPALLVAVGPSLVFDTALYHLQSIRWIEEYGVVPGLANLHGRLGFNNSIFTLYALTSLQGLFGREVFSLNLLVFLAFLIYALQLIFQIYNRRGINNQLLFTFMMLLVVLTLSRNLSSPTPDFMAQCLSIWLLVSWVDTGISKPHLTFQDEIPGILIVCYLITIKLSTLPLLLMPLMLCLKYRPGFKTWLVPVVISLVMVSPWLWRNVILTGWLIYPVSGINMFHFDWQVPLNGVMLEQRMITAWARLPDDTSYISASWSLVQWFPLWWQRAGHVVQTLLVLGLLSPLTIITYLKLRKQAPAFHQGMTWLICYTGVGFWLFTAPDLRFGATYLISLAISPLIFIQFKTKLELKPVIAKVLIVGALSAYFFLAFTKDIVTRENNHGSAQWLKPIPIRPPEGLSFDSTAVGSIMIYMPLGDHRCFDHCLPCTPYAPDSVAWRGDNISEGLRHIKP